MKNCVKLSLRKLKKYKFEGNFLYKNEKTYFFADRIYNTLFINESEKSNPENLKNEIENYFVEFFEACGMMKTCPSILFFGEPENKQKYIDALGNNYVEITNKKHSVILEKSPSIYFVKDEKYFVELLENLITKRTDIFAPNNIYIVIDKLENLKLKQLVNYLAVTRSRRLHITFVVYDKAKFAKAYSPEDVELIRTYCFLKFTCDDDNILSIEINNNEIPTKK